MVISCAPSTGATDLPPRGPRALHHVSSATSATGTSGWPTGGSSSAALAPSGGSPGASGGSGAAGSGGVVPGAAPPSGLASGAASPLNSARRASEGGVAASNVGPNQAAPAAAVGLPPMAPAAAAGAVPRSPQGPSLPMRPSTPSVAEAAAVVGLAGAASQSASTATLSALGFQSLQSGHGRGSGLSLLVPQDSNMQGGITQLSLQTSMVVPDERLSAFQLASHRSTAGQVPARHGGVRGMPDNPLQLLRRLVELIRHLVSQLRELCLKETLVPDPVGSGSVSGGGHHGHHTGGALGGAGGAGVSSRYSSLSHEPGEWALEPGLPCSGERLLLMFDRWQKLHKSFYNEKKDRFDISKVLPFFCSFPRGRGGGCLCR